MRSLISSSLLLLAACGLPEPPAVSHACPEALLQVAAPAASPAGNLLRNPGLELQAASGQPQGWSSDSWGDNTPVFRYPVPGVSGRAAQVALTSHRSGDAKWASAEVPVARGVYGFSTAYQASAASALVARLREPGGAVSYHRLGAVSPSPGFRGVATELWVPAAAAQLSVLQLLEGVGELTVDNVGLVRAAEPAGPFERGAVSLSFDDGYATQFEVALPKMNAAGMKASFYLITRALSESGRRGYMSWSQVEEIYRQGHEIGAHTRRHPRLSQLSAQRQWEEIGGARQDLLDHGLGPAKTMAYPFGDYDCLTRNLAVAAGFDGVVMSSVGRVAPTTDRAQLPRFGFTTDTTLAEAKEAIDAAIANREWLILEFHHIGDFTDEYAITAALFEQVIDYLVERRVAVIPVSAGLSALRPHGER